MKNLISISLALLLLSCGNSQTEEKTFVDWGKEEAIEIKTLEPNEDQSDIEPISKIIGDATVVCLGESRHDIHEQFVLKYQFIKYMVVELGFKTFILEASLPYSEKINAFINDGIGIIDELMSEMPGWFLWDTQEMKDTIAWMRKYNENQPDDKKIQFYGIDIVAPMYAIEKTFKYLQKVDTNFYLNILESDFAKNELDDNFWQNSLQAYSAFSTERKISLNDNYNNLLKIFKSNKDEYVKKSSEKEYEKMLRFVYCAKQANRMFSAEKRLNMGLIRDSAMANNTSWIINKIARNKKAIVWAHNVHIAKSEFEMTGETERIKGMGYILHQELKDDMVSIGAAFYEGEFLNWNNSFAPADENTLEGKFERFGYDYFILDIRGNPGNKNISEMLATQQMIRGQGFEMTTIPNKAFDAFFFTKEISRTMPCEISLEKYRNMN